MTKEDLQKDQALPLVEKIEKTKELIKAYYKAHEGGFTWLIVEERIAQLYYI